MGPVRVPRQNVTLGVTVDTSFGALFVEERIRVALVPDTETRLD